MRKLKNPVLFLFIAGTICAAGTAAYFSDSDNRINEVAVGTVTTEIEENFPDPTPTPMENNPSYRKEIWRGVEILGMDTVNWVYSNEDGYYYYRNVVAEGEKTTPLCTGFRIDSAKIDDTYKNSLSDFAINIYEESVQAEGFEDFKSAWRYFDNPISGNAERGRNG